MKSICFTLPTMDQCVFRIKAEPEDIRPYDLIIELNDDPAGREQFLTAVEDNQRLSVFGWCSIRVVAEWRGQTGEDSLGACSYSSEEDFKKGGYYEQMKKAAYDELITALGDLSD